MAVQFSNPPKLYYIAFGSDDFVKKLNLDLRNKLDDNGYKYVLEKPMGDTHGRIGVSIFLTSFRVCSVLKP